MRIGLVHPAPAAAVAIARAIAGTPQHQVLWVAKSGEDAVARCAGEAPDVVLISLTAPGLAGSAAMRAIVGARCAVLVVTEDLQLEGGRVFEAMGHGALDALELPGLESGHAPAAPLLAKLDVVRRLIGEQRPPRAVSTSLAPEPKRLIAIGASAGGPAALARLLGALPVSLRSAIVVVQHVDAQFAAGMADWLAQHTPLPVRLALEGDAPTEGTVLIAGTADHLVLKAPGRLGYTPDPIQNAYRPSVDVFFHSVTQYWQGEAFGVLLTGMGRDGAAGLKAMRGKGHHTIAQDEASSAVYGMPKAAAKLGAAVDVLALDDIAARLLRA